jgi:hypothetical protein
LELNGHRRAAAVLTGNARKVDKHGKYESLVIQNKFNNKVIDTKVVSPSVETNELRE